MIFRYDFGRKLDLTKFKKQSVHYITYMNKVSYHIFIKNYKLVAEINKSENNELVTSFYIYNVNRDADGDISDASVIFPLASPIFKEVLEISNMYSTYEDKGLFICNSPDQVSNKICRVATILFKINELIAFA